jgi:hypothetical protein
MTPMGFNETMTPRSWHLMQRVFPPAQGRTSVAIASFQVGDESASGLSETSQ